MSDSWSGRPRRTRQSTRRASSPSTTTPATPVTPVYKNPYKKPAYLASKERSSTGRGESEKKGTSTPVSTYTPRGGRRSRGRPPGSGGGGRGGAGSSVRGRNVRPECVATRVDRRSSTTNNSASNASRKKRRGGYNSHDYHYGSDFESDDNESEPEENQASTSESESPDDTILEETVESDSDLSVASSRQMRLPSPPVPIWLEPDNVVEELEIPRSSDDLLLQREYVVKAVSIYEPLRRFHQLVRLTPFRFEDFCAALASEEQSSLLAEIHIQLLKTILREDDNSAVVYGPNEVKDSVQSVLFFIDNLTWSESLRSYIESDPSWADLLKEITSVEYPFCGPEVRIKVLSWLVDLFLTTNPVRESLLSEGNILHEDHCRSCNRLGELICCETCPAVYHLNCIDPPIREDDDPPDDWKCAICKKHKLPGVMDCTSELEKAGLLIRHEKLGHDRHGRKYWFLARRILVESDDGKDVWYYTTRLQVEELLQRLDSEHYEAELVDAIRNQKDEIYSHMAITEKVTNSQNSHHRKTYLDAENAFLKKIHEDREALRLQEEEERARVEEEARLLKQKEEDEKARVEEEKKSKAEAEKKRKREERLARRNKNKFTNPNGKEYEDLLEDGDQQPLTPEEQDSSSTNNCSDENNIDANETSLCTSNQMDVKTIESSNNVNETNDEEKKMDVENSLNEVDSKPKDDEKVQLGEQNLADTKEIVKDEEIVKSEVEVEKIKEEPVAPTSEETNSESSKSSISLDSSSKEVSMKEESQSVETPPVVGCSTPVENKPKDCKIITRSKTGSLTPKIHADGESESVGNTPSRQRKSKALYLDVDSEERVTRLKSTGLYKLGQEGAFRSYVNTYSNDSLALSKAQHNEERDRRRHMSHKFSLTVASECKWSGGQTGYRSTIVGTMRATLLHLETALPGTLMHVNWPMLRKAWITAVSACVSCKDFSKAMIALAACIRPAVFNPCWGESTGHVKLFRMSALDREERKKAEKREKKDKDDEEDRIRLVPQFVKYSIPPKHQIYKQKGEEYRVHGRWGWLWMSTLRPNKPKDARKLGLLNGPNKHVIQVKNELGKVKTMLIDPVVFDKLMAKRSLSMSGQKTPSTPSTPVAATPTSMSTTSTPVKKSEDAPGVSNDVEMEEQKDKEVKREDTSQTKSVVEGNKSKNCENENSEGTCDDIAKNDTKMDVDEVKIEELHENELKSKVEKQSENIEMQPEKEMQTENAVLQKNQPLENEIPTKSEVAGTDVEVKDEKAEASSECQQALSNPLKDEKTVDDTPEKEIEVVEKSSSDEKPSSEELSKHDMSSMGRKFKTELVNVSLGIVSANRILYPKIAHRIPVLDNLLTRRTKWQAIEEKEQLATFGAEAMKKVKEAVILANKKREEEKLHENRKTDEDSGQNVEDDDDFPQAGIYIYRCYSNLCQGEASRAKKGAKKSYEGICYSPMCRLKFCLQEAQREKKDKAKNAKEKEMEELMKKVDAKRMYTQTNSSGKVYLKKLAENLKKKRNQVKYPHTSNFRSIGSKKPSALILPQHELKKLARTGGRSLLPVGFTPAPKPGTWAWPYPCGRPFFKTAWQFRTVHCTNLAGAAMQMRTLYASIRWDDIQMKPPNTEGKYQITTDMEIITAEILNHRIVGRFMERVQYLRKKQIVPIDAPKTIRAKSRDTSDVTPSRSGLRKRKRVESPEKSDPIVTEEWVDEDKVELWEIKYYGDKLDKKVEKKPDTPSTRMKSGVVLKHPEKYDPSSTPSTPNSTEDKVEKKNSAVSPTKTAELMREQLETELKMQRAVHLSKRDNHAKANNASVPKTPTASQQLQQQNIAAGLPANPRSYASATSTGGASGIPTKKFFAGKAAATAAAVASNLPSAASPTNAVGKKPIETPLGGNPVILNRKIVPGVVHNNKAVAVVTSTSNQNTPPVTPAVVANPPPTTGVNANTPPATVNQMPAQRLTVYRSADGKLNVKGLLPGQQCYQTSDGKIHVTAAPQQQMQQQIQQQTKAVATTTTASSIFTQQQQHQKLLAPTTTASIINKGLLQQTQQQQQIQMHATVQTQHVSSGMESTASTPTTNIIQNQQPITTAPMSTVAAAPLINISNPAYKSAITGQQSISNTPVALKSQPLLTPQHVASHQVVTYSNTPKNSRKSKIITSTPANVNVSSPVMQNAISTAPALLQNAISSPLMQNAAGSLVFTTAAGNSARIIRSSPHQQGGQQYIIASTGQHCQIQSQPTIALSSSGDILTTAGGGSVITTTGGKPNVVVSTGPPKMSAITVAATPQMTSGINLGGLNIPAGAGNRILLNDGTKTVVINAGGLTQQQLQALAAQIQSKKVVVKQQGSVQPQLTVQQQQPQQQQQQTVQIIQQGGGAHGAIQLIQQQHQTPQIQGQQGQHYVITTGGAGVGGAIHQLATIGGQQVLVKKVIKAATPPTSGVLTATGGAPRLPTSSPVTLVTSTTSNLMSPGKNVIRVMDPNNPGGTVLRVQSSVGDTIGKMQAQLAPRPLAPTSVATTTMTLHAGVTKAQGLPISIVSPSKVKVATHPQKVPISSPNITTTTPAIRAIAPVIQRMGVPGMVAQTQAQVVPKILPSTTPPKITTVMANTTTTTSAVMSNAATSGSLQMPSVALQPQPVPTPMKITTPTTVLAPAATVVSQGLGSASVLGPIAQSPQQQQQLQQQPATSLPVSTLQQPKSNIVPNVVGQNVGQNVVANTTPSSPQKSLSPQKPQKIVAQIFQTASGPKVVIQGVQPGELTQAQMAQLQQQISKQLNIGGLMSPPRTSPASISAQPTTPTPPAAVPTICPTTLTSPPNNKNVSDTIKAVAESQSLLPLNPTVVPAATSPVVSASSMNTSPALTPHHHFIKHSEKMPSAAVPTSSLLPSSYSAVVPSHQSAIPVTSSTTSATTPVIATKSAPNIASSQSLMEAIEAVASATSTVTIPPPKMSPRKSLTPKTPKGKGQSKPPILKNILQKTEEGLVVARKSSPHVPPPDVPGLVESPKKGKGGGKKTPKAKVTPVAIKKEGDLVVAVKSAPPAIPPTSPQKPIIGLPGSIVGAGIPVEPGPRFILSQDLANQASTTLSPSLSAVVTPPPLSSPIMASPTKGISTTNQEAASICSENISQIIRSVGHQLSQEHLPTSDSTAIVTTTPAVPEPSPITKPAAKKKSPATKTTDSGTSKSSVGSAAAGSNAMGMTPPKLVSALFRHKELLKKDIFKKRGLLEKELTIDIQKEISEEIAKSKGSLNVASPSEVNASGKVGGGMGQKRKGGPDQKSGGLTTSINTSNDSLPHPKNSSNRPSPPKKRKKGNKLYCICKTPYDNSKFYVGCDVCSNWYHGDCIGITEQMSACLSEYVCDACQADSKKLYCLCRQPYDESQFYICCDTCQDWFHGRCVGILQAEAGDIEEYICPNCDSSTPLNHANLKPLSYEDYPLLSKLLKQIQTHKSSWPFLEPVDQSEAPNYYRVIKEPMDLQTVEFRVDEKCYSRLRDFIGDVTKIFDNCRYYNPTESPFYKSAESLEAFFAQKITLLRQRLS